MKRYTFIMTFFIILSSFYGGCLDTFDDQETQQSIGAALTSTFALSALAPPVLPALSFDLNFQPSYSNNSIDTLTAMQSTKDGGLVLGGTTTMNHRMVGGQDVPDAYFSKYARYGQNGWIRTFGETIYNESVSVIKQTRDAGYVMAVARVYCCAESAPEYAVRKYTSNGTLVWTTSRVYYLYRVTELIECADGGFVMGGIRVNGELRDHPTLNVIKFDRDGIERWVYSEEIGPAYMSKSPLVITEMTGGKLLVAGSMQYLVPLQNMLDDRYNFATWQLSANGILERKRTALYGMRSISRILRNGDGSFYVYNAQWNMSLQDDSPVLVKVGSDLQTLWRLDAVPGFTKGVNSDIIGAPDNGCLVVWGNGSVYKIDATGNTAWSMDFDFNTDDFVISHSGFGVYDIGFNYSNIYIPGAINIIEFYDGIDIVARGENVIEAENYSVGWDGGTFHDTDNINQGGAYRSDGVDIERSTEGGLNVGWIANDEWLVYDARIAASGYYKLKLRVSRAWYDQNCYVHLECDGASVTRKIFIPNTGGFQNWTTVEYNNVLLYRGIHKLKLVMDGNTFNVDRMSLSFTSPVNDRIVILGSGFSTIQAEDYDKGGEGIGYHDTTPGNTGNAYRSDDVDIESCSEGGYLVGWTDNGEWLRYNVFIQRGGVYTLKLRTARAWYDRNSYAHVECDGKNISGAIFIPDTGGFRNWSTVVVRNVSLPYGNHVLRLVMDGNTFNVNWFGFER